MQWERALFEAGVEVHAVDSRHVRLNDGVWNGVVRLVRWWRAPRPSEMDLRIGALTVGTPTLVVSPTLSRTVRAELDRAGVWWVADGALSVAGVRRESSESAGEYGPADRASGDVQLPFRGRSGFQVVRRILEWGFDRTPLHDDERTQRKIAVDAGVSQPRVSQTVARLRAKGLIVDDGPPRVANRAGLLDRWLAGYPGPGGVTAGWFSLDGPRAAASAAMVAADEAGVGAWLSGDVAGDILAPWARPQRAVVYAERAVDLTSVGLVPTPGGEGANLFVVVADDPTVVPVGWYPVEGDLDGRTVQLADVLQVLWDVANGDGPDVGQAVEVLRRKVLEEWLHC
jgi:hypothetical protein